MIHPLKAIKGLFRGDETQLFSVSGYLYTSKKKKETQPNNIIMDIKCGFCSENPHWTRRLYQSAHSVLDKDLTFQASSSLVG